MQKEEVVPVLVQEHLLIRLECRSDAVDRVVLVHSVRLEAIRQPADSVTILS